MKLSILGMGIFLSLATAAMAQDQPVKMADLPAPVRRAVQAQLAKGASLRGLSTDIEGGQREYEAELTVAGHHRDLAMNSQGTILEAEEPVALSSLPAAARAGLAKRGRVLRVESVSHNGKFVAYEAVVQKANGKRTEVRVDRRGRSVPDNG